MNYLLLQSVRFEDLPLTEVLARTESYAIMAGLENIPNQAKKNESKSAFNQRNQSSNKNNNYNKNRNQYSNQNRNGSSYYSNFNNRNYKNGNKNQNNGNRNSKTPDVKTEPRDQKEKNSF